MMDIDDRRVTKVSFDGKRVKVLYEIPRVGSEDPDDPREGDHQEGADR